MCEGLQPMQLSRKRRNANSFWKKKHFSRRRNPRRIIERTMVKTFTTKEIEFRYRRRVDIIDDTLIGGKKPIYFWIWQDGYTFDGITFRKKVEKEKKIFLYKNDFFKCVKSLEYNNVVGLDAYSTLCLLEPIALEVRIFLKQTADQRVMLVKGMDSFWYIDYECEICDENIMPSFDLFDNYLMDLFRNNKVKFSEYFGLKRCIKDVYREKIKAKSYVPQTICAAKLDGIFGNLLIDGNRFMILDEKGFSLNNFFSRGSSRYTGVLLAIEILDNHQIFITDILKYHDTEVVKEATTYLNFESICKSITQDLLLFQYQHFSKDKKLQSKEGTIFLFEGRWFKDKARTTFEMVFDGKFMMTGDGHQFVCSDNTDNCRRGDIFEVYFTQNDNCRILRKRLDRFAAQILKAKK